MINTNLITIIIPVYNVEDYIVRCIDSIINQTYSNLEIILVDDGSTDSCPYICNEYEQKDKRIKVIHKENGGVSSARNCGMKAATGSYIAFVDADDYIAYDYIEVLYNDMKNYKVDIACCDCVEILQGVPIKRFHLVVKTRIVNSIDDYTKDLYRNKEFYFTTVWGKLIRRDMLEGIYFDTNIKNGEDTVFFVKVLEKIPMIRLNVYQGYYYVRRDESATGGGRDNKKNTLMKLQYIVVGDELLCLGAKGSAENMKTLADCYSRYIFDALRGLIICDMIDLYHMKRTYLAYHIDKVLRIRGINPKYRIVLEFYRKYPVLFRVTMKNIPMFRNKLKE